MVPWNWTSVEKEIVNMVARLDYWHTTMPFLGTRKLATQLRSEGYAVGRKLVRSCMQEMGIHAVYPKANLSKRNFKEAIVPYLLRNKLFFDPECCSMCATCSFLRSIQW